MKTVPANLLGALTLTILLALWLRKLSELAWLIRLFTRPLIEELKI